MQIHLLRSGADLQTTFPRIWSEFVTPLQKAVSGSLYRGSRLQAFEWTAGSTLQGPGIEAGSSARKEALTSEAISGFRGKSSLQEAPCSPPAICSQCDSHSLIQAVHMPGSDNARLIAVPQAVWISDKVYIE